MHSFWLIYGNLYSCCVKILKHYSFSGNRQFMKRCLMLNKNMYACRLGSSILQIVDYCPTNILRQRQFQWVARFLVGNRYFFVCPINVTRLEIGMAPMPMTVLPKSRVINAMPAANIMDNVPFMNILPFAMCRSMTNPAVAAATAAAFGALTPMQCTPVTTAPWVPGSPTVLIGGQPALNDSSQLICSFGGCIQIKAAGQFRISVP